MESMMSTEGMFRATNVGLVMVGAETISDSHSTAEFAAIAYHKYLDFRGYLAVSAELPVPTISAVLFLACKITEHVRSLHTCIIAAIQLVTSISSKQSISDEEIAIFTPIAIEKEHEILRILAFRTNITLPSRTMKSIVRDYSLPKTVKRASEAIIKKLLLTRESGTFSGDLIAAGVVMFVAATSGIQLPKHWLRDYDLTEGKLKPIQELLVAISR